MLTQFCLTESDHIHLPAAEHLNNFVYSDCVAVYSDNSL